jgi:hypothetical protein
LLPTWRMKRRRLLRSQIRYCLINFAIFNEHVELQCQLYFTGSQAAFFTVCRSHFQMFWGSSEYLHWVPRQVCTIVIR